MTIHASIITTQPLPPLLTSFFFLLSSYFLLLSSFFFLLSSFFRLLSTEFPLARRSSKSAGGWRAVAHISKAALARRSSKSEGGPGAP